MRNGRFWSLNADPKNLLAATISQSCYAQKRLSGMAEDAMPLNLGGP